jgi:hypothetical protein
MKRAKLVEREQERGGEREAENQVSLRYCRCGWMETRSASEAGCACVHASAFLAPHG